jgi:hypothetical protein
MKRPGKATSASKPTSFPTVVDTITSSNGALTISMAALAEAKQRYTAQRKGNTFPLTDQQLVDVLERHGNTPDDEFATIIDAVSHKANAPVPPIDDITKKPPAPSVIGPRKNNNGRAYDPTRAADQYLRVLHEERYETVKWTDENGVEHSATRSDLIEELNKELEDAAAADETKALAPLVVAETLMHLFTPEVMRQWPTVGSEETLADKASGVNRIYDIVRKKPPGEKRMRIYRFTHEIADGLPLGSQIKATLEILEKCKVKNFEATPMGPWKLPNGEMITIYKAKDESGKAIDRVGEGLVNPELTRWTNRQTNLRRVVTQAIEVFQQLEAIRELDPTKQHVAVSIRRDANGNIARMLPIRIREEDGNRDKFENISVNDLRAYQLDKVKEKLEANAKARQEDPKVRELSFYETITNSKPSKKRDATTPAGTGTPEDATKTPEIAIKTIIDGAASFVSRLYDITAFLDADGAYSKLLAIESNPNDKHRMVLAKAIVDCYDSLDTHYKVCEPVVRKYREEQLAREQEKLKRDEADRKATMQPPAAA